MTETDRGVWGRLIATRRDQLDLTQEQLADAAGVSEKTVYNVESGDVIPRPGTLRKLKEALGLPDDIRMAARFVRAAAPKADLIYEDSESTTVIEMKTGRISRKQLFDFAQLVAEAIDAGESGEEFTGALTGWTPEQRASLDRIVRDLLSGHDVRDVSGHRDTIRAVASTEKTIEGAGEFDDEHLD